MVKRLRILHVAEVRGIGGLQNWCLGLAEAQQRMGHEVAIISPPYVGDQEIPSILSGKIPLRAWDIGCFKEADVIHLYGPSEIYAPLIKKQYPYLPIFCTSFGAHPSVLLALGRWLNVGWYLNFLRHWHMIRREAIGLRWVDRIIASSRRVMKEVYLFYRVPVSKITVIHGGYWKREINATKEELRKRLGLPVIGKLILFVGRPDPVKGFDSVLKCFKKLRSQRKDVFLITAPPQEFDNQEGVIGLRPFWHQMPELYCACDILVSASKYEGYSLAIHEAMAYGLPVIIPDCVGIIDLCVPNENAIVLPRWNNFEKRLLEALERLLEDEFLRLRLGQNARATMEHRTWDWVAQETEKVYISVLEGSK